MEKLIACTFCRTICFLDNMKLIGEAKTDIFFFCLGFLSRIFTIPRKAGEKGGYLFNSSLPPTASHTLRHQTSDYCRQFTSAHSQQPEANQEVAALQKTFLANVYTSQKVFFIENVRFDTRKLKFQSQQIALKGEGLKHILYGTRKIPNW